MKRFCEILSAAFLLAGAVIGAGFLSGRELVSFFGTRGFLPFLFFAGLLFAAGFSLLFYAAKKTVLENGKLLHGFNAAFYFADYVFAVAMLSGLNELSSAFGLFGGAPVLPFLSLSFVWFYSKKGSRGMELINSVLMPVALIAVIAIVFTRGEPHIPSGGSAAPAQYFFKTCLFACMNIFISAPAAVAAAENKSFSSLCVSACLFAVLTVFIAALVLSAVSGNPAAENSELPLLYATGGAPSVIFGVALLLGMFTSFYACYSPLSAAAETKCGVKGKAALTLSAFAFSFLRTGAIIDFVYPLVGALGAVFMLRLAFRYIPRRIKRRDNDDNKNILFYRRKIYVEKEKK